MLATVDILNILRDYKNSRGVVYGILEMGLFGSVARGEQNPSSDVDIYIRTTTPNPFNILHIKEELKAILKCPIDVIRMRENMNPYLKNQIQKDGIAI